DLLDLLASEYFYAGGLPKKCGAAEQDRRKDQGCGDGHGVSQPRHGVQGTGGAADLRRVDENLRPWPGQNAIPNGSDQPWLQGGHLFRKVSGPVYFFAPVRLDG